MKKFISYLVALMLLAATPALGQIIPRGGGGGGGGGGGDASAANQATQITALPLEDALAVSGDRGTGVLGVANLALTTRAGDGDYLFPALSTSGVSLSMIVNDTAVGAIRRATDVEDSAPGTGHAGMVVFRERDDVLAAGAGVSTDGDLVYPKSDNFGSGWGALTADDGARIPADSTTGLLVNVSAVTPGTAVSELGAQEDQVATNVKVGVASMTVRDDVLQAGAGVSGDGDFTFTRVDNRGGLWLAHSGASFFAITDTAIAAVSQNFAFGFTSKKVFISAPATNGDGVCIDHAGGTAVCPASDTAGDDVLEPGETISIDEHAVTSVSAISASGTNTIVVRAFN